MRLHDKGERALSRAREAEETFRKKRGLMCKLTIGVENGEVLKESERPLVKGAISGEGAWIKALCSVRDSIPEGTQKLSERSLKAVKGSLRSAVPPLL